SWLAVSNALSFAEVPVRIWTTSMAPTPTTTGPVAIDAVWSGVDIEMATPLERELAAELTRLGAPPPTSSLDEINGVPVTFAWQNEGVV
ncbi:hypothetical protein, partial [Salmonella enterica]|uniref:hypothetical protein n=1 Tax=Salmonella enterica TaxID=28901 RepID=UPI0015CD5C8B